MEPKGLLALLKENKNRVSTSERDIIAFVLEQPELVVGLTIHELAAKTFVSASTISRLFHKLHVGGYKQFQQFLLYELASTKLSTQSTIEDINPQDSTKQIMFKLMRRTIESITVTEKLNSAHTFDACVELMHNARVINAFGIGSSLLSAQDLQQKLLRVNIACSAYADWHMQLIAANNMQPGDAAVAFSYSGVTREVLRCVKTARERGGKVIGITRSASNRGLAREADVVLYVAAIEPLLRSSAGTSRISQLMLVDMLFTALVNKHFDEYSTVIENNYIQRAKA